MTSSPPINIKLAKKPSLQVISFDTFNALPAINRAILKVMEEEGKVRIEPDPGEKP